MIRILLAEDDQVMREYLSRALEKSGYAVTAVDRGTAALPLIEDWMRENRGPEARLAEITANTILAVQRLPDAVEAVERAATTITDGRLSLDLRNASSPKWPLWLAIGVTAVLAVIALAD